MKINNIDDIYLFPAKFAANIDDNHCMIDCYVGDSKGNYDKIEKRKFERKILDNIDDPTYLFLGIIYGEGFMVFNIVDAIDYKNVFKKKWKELIM